MSRQFTVIVLDREAKQTIVGEQTRDAHFYADTEKYMLELDARI